MKAKIGTTSVCCVLRSGKEYIYIGRNTESCRDVILKIVLNVKLLMKYADEFNEQMRIS